MTEQDWLDSDDPWAMLAWIKREGPAVSLRELRLFAVGCARNVVGNDARRVFIDLGLSVAELYADGLAKPRELAIASLQMPAGCIEGKALWGDHDLWAGVGGLLRFKGSPQSLNAVLLREIIGNPFRPVSCAPSARAMDMAGLIYAQRDFGSLPVLADMLEEDGCLEKGLLLHLRDVEVTHAPGCWALDLIIGKE